MIKLGFLLAISISLVMATPEPGILAAAPLAVAPAVAPAVVTATSSQSFVRNVNKFVTPVVAARLVASPAIAAPYVAAPAQYVSAAGPLIL